MKESTKAKIEATINKLLSSNSLVEWRLFYLSELIKTEVGND